MPLSLFLNELSCQSDAGPRHVDEAMATFVATLKHLKSWGQNVELVTESPLQPAELARGYVYQQWVNASPRNRERHRYILRLRDRTPGALRGVLEAAGHDPAEVEHFHDGRRAIGIGAAHLVDGMAISLPVSPKWAASWLDVDINRVGEDDIETYQDKVKHCSTPHSADEHETWARGAGLSSLTRPSQLLDAWEEFFPRLERLPRFDRDLRALDPKWFLPVRGLLADLQSTAADHWNLARSPEPDWQNPHITPESQSRRHLCTFADPDLDGRDACFSWHGRMTPGKGRLYFRLVPERKSFRLGYVGDKPGSDRLSN
ncbi:hypothetical protein AQJ67_14510 [Streptomyces caeruleatus]|uniref:Uncharacterized protein n=2 Tax=Streptomyces caeruleatus TaxID=661399 RepID=A0A101U4M3_9ACTN|nr:hypothetical protein AQJ67_14510 [Streptomyces caeruleatus]